MDNQPGLNELALFAGAGGGILGGKLLGWRTVCAVEIERYAAAVLCARQNDGILTPFPIWDNVCSFDGRPWRGLVDVVSGGFPCTDISVAGSGAGIDGKKSGLWREMRRIICEVRPRHVFVENSPALTVRGLDRVLGDLAAGGYDAKWCVLSAADCGAPHERRRIWIKATLADAGSGQCVESGFGQMEQPKRTETERTGDAGLADANRTRWQGQCVTGSIGAEISRVGCACAGLADADQRGCDRRSRSRGKSNGRRQPADCDWWAIEPNVDRMVNGMAARVDRLKAIGNGQVSRVAAVAWKILSK